MRTTITLEPDVATKIRKLMRERKLSFKDAINTVLRRGLEPGRGRGGKPFRTETFDMGSHAPGAFDKALAMADGMEDAEILRKLSVRK